MEEIMDYEVENTEEVSQSKKKVVVTETILQFNEHFRARISSHDVNMNLERKNKYDDGSEGWVHDGHFTQFDSMFKDMFNTMIKIRVSAKAQTETKDLWDAIRATEEEHIKWMEIRRLYENSKSKQVTN